MDSKDRDQGSISQRVRTSPNLGLDLGGIQNVWLVPGIAWLGINMYLVCSNTVCIYLPGKVCSKRTVLLNSTIAE